MHGQPRKPKPEDPAASAAKAEKLRSLQTQLLQNHRDRTYTKEAIEISAKLLEVNPEVYTAWNYRKLAVQSIIGSVSDPEEFKSIVNAELRIVEIALRRNPKCYGAWHHRKWVLQRELSLTNYEHEFRLLDQLLKADSRNFHGWNYRRFVAAMKNVSEEDELKFMTDKINANFSNYSAWHNRSVLLSQLLKKKGQDSFMKEKLLAEEFELVHQALFTDPDDQSGWFYYLWLLDQTTASYNPIVISSWPTNGSKIVLLPNGIIENQISFLSSQWHYVTHKETLPLFLFFSQPVKSVKTVTAQSLFVESEDLIWKPLSSTNSEEALYWVTRMKMPKVEVHSSSAYPVEIAIDYSLGSTCTYGTQNSNPYELSFSLNIGCTDPNPTKVLMGMEIFCWEDDNSYTNVTLAPEVECAVSLERLQIAKDLEPAASKWHVETLSNEMSLFRELLCEIDCKIARLTVARLLVALDAIMSRELLTSQKKTHSEEVLKLYDELMKSDPMHVNYYKDQRSLVLMDQVTFDKELLAKRCYRKASLNFSRFQNCITLRLNSLSLSRIGFSQRLLWVQMLDLSNNELTSIEGLEALQLLCCLNLRGNKIRSFTALEPLKLMCSLEVLDISYNEIGAHPIDTTRYFCASPLSHSIGNDSDKENGKEGDIKVTASWETVSLFQNLQLIQLDITGNVIATDEFRMLVVKVLPTLCWFDGVEV